MPLHLFLIAREYHAGGQLPPAELLIKVQRVRCCSERHVEEACQPRLKVLHDLTANSSALVIRMNNHIHHRGQILPVVNRAAKPDEPAAVKGEAFECALAEGCT